MFPLPVGPKDTRQAQPRRTSPCRPHSHPGDLGSGSPRHCQMEPKDCISKLLGAPHVPGLSLALVTVPRETHSQATGTTGCEGWSHTEGVTLGPSEGDCRQADDREQQVGRSPTGMSGEARRTWGSREGGRGCPHLHPQVPRAPWAPAGMPWAGGCSSPAPSFSRPSACGWRGAPL